MTPSNSSLLSSNRSDNSTLDSLEDEEERELQLLREIFKYFFVIYPICLLLVGIPANLLTLWILRKPSQIAHVLSILLRSLTWLNLLVLLVGLVPKVIEAVWDIDVLGINQHVCHFGIAVQSWLQGSCSWVLVTTSLFRLYGLWRPDNFLKVDMRSRCSAVCMLILFLTLGSQFYITFQNTTHGEAHLDLGTVCKLESDTLIGHLINVSVTAVCPLIALLLTHTSVQCLSLKKHRVLNPHMIHKPYGWMVLACDLHFIATVLPVVVATICQDLVFDTNTHRGQIYADLGIKVAYQILYTTNSTNIFLYIWLSQVFKTELRRTMRCKRTWRKITRLQRSSSTSLSGLSQDMPFHVRSGSLHAPLANLFQLHNRPHDPVLANTDIIPLAIHTDDPDKVHKLAIAMSTLTVRTNDVKMADVRQCKYSHPDDKRA